MQNPSFTPPIPADVRVNPIRNAKDWQTMRMACTTDAGAFHGQIAAQEIHWFHPQLQAWLSQKSDGSWQGWQAKTGQAVSCPQWTPWQTALDETDAPFYRWFSGAKTNAAFNETDRHLLSGYGAETAYFYEGDRWDASANNGRGGPVHQRIVSRRELLIQSVLCAQVLLDLGLQKGDRIALNLPNIPEQIFWTEGAKRLGVIYTPVFGGFSDKTLSDRIEDAGAKIVITADGASRNAQVAPFKEAYTDPALDRYISLKNALRILEKTKIPLQNKIAASLRYSLLEGVRSGLAGEITVTPGDVMREVGCVLSRTGDLSAQETAGLRAVFAEALAQAPQRVKCVIVVRHAGLPDVAWTDGRDVWAEDLLPAAEQKICAKAGVSDRTELETFTDTELLSRLWRSVPPLPLEADFPLFIIYTSGSTGKPKGVVHVHGGYVAGVTHTMKVSFDALPAGTSGADGDVMYVVADPGWITGQSYLITACLAARIPGIITEGAPVFPHSGRFASIIERYGVTIFKAGVTFLKTVMANPQNHRDMEHYDRSGLRVATFCAEPTSPAVQQFGMEVLTSQYINSYWATEHGGIVWTHPFGNPDQPLRADARTWPLPWIFGDVWITENETDKHGRLRAHSAEPGERGEIVITRPYPYLARTIWGDAENVNESGWKGDLSRFTKTYFGRFCDNSGKPIWAYLQGDFARRHAEGSFSLHGRSDDVINVSGHRMGTEEIEGAILKDKQHNPQSPVGNCIVVGAPHQDKGLTPVVFILPASGNQLTPDDERRLKNLVRSEKGAVAVPEDFITLSAFPETRSGKYMRRFLKALMLGEPLGDTSTLRNPECLPEIEERVRHWKHGQKRTEQQTLFENRRSLKTQFDPVAFDKKGRPLRVATLTIFNPPVNALSERVLDDLDTQLSHITRRNDVRAVVIAGSGSRTFVAGADVRQLLEEVHNLEESRALPAKAHAVFRRIEEMNKPVIAAIEGVALGGGCELAMACHWRVGSNRTRMGQPEINLFLPPGYGGTQRLPRLLTEKQGLPGVCKALHLLLSGRQIDGETALRLGLLDRLVEGAEDVLSTAQQAARAIILKENYVPEITKKQIAADGNSAFEAFRSRQFLLADWHKPAVYPEKIVLLDEYIAACLKQANEVGRGPVARAVMELVRTGFEKGFEAGLAAEAETFAKFVMDEKNGGKRGIRLFLDKQSPPLISRRPRPNFDQSEQENLIRKGRLLPSGTPFFPGITPLPEWQFAHAVVRNRKTGAYAHGDPKSAEVSEIIAVPRPSPNQALLYVLVSEVNFNDIWAITGIPVSLFDEHDEDVHVTGSGGVGLVVQLGESLQEEGRLALGSLAAIYSGVSDLLDPEAGNDPMQTRFHIQGYQSPDGSHQQFMLADGPQLFALPSGITVEAAGSYMLTAGTVYRALHSTLKIRPSSRLFVEGAATGSGAWAVQMGVSARCRVTGLVSSPERQATIAEQGASGIDRKSAGISGCFTKIPADPKQWPDWENAGEKFINAVREANDGELCDYAVSHAGENAFPRTFQTLAEGGVLAFFGASSGYQLTFLGKKGQTSATEMFHRADLRAGEAVLVFYGGGTHERDDDALVSIEAAREFGARIVVITDEDSERDFVLSLGFGDAVVGALSLAEILRRVPHFEWPETLPELPDPQRQTEDFKETVRQFTENSFKPLGAAVGRLLRSADNPRGMPDLIVERAHRDSLAVSTMLVKPHSGRVVYTGEMHGRRYSFYAPQVWMRQRRIYLPSAAIFGTHLSNAAEIAGLNRMIESGALSVQTPFLGVWETLPQIHQAMWENRLPEFTAGFSKAVVNHALPEAGLKTREALYTAWKTLDKPECPVQDG